jgi:hypothetical protein
LVCLQDYKDIMCVKKLALSTAGQQATVLVLLSYNRWEGLPSPGYPYPTTRHVFQVVMRSFDQRVRRCCVPGTTLQARQYRTSWVAEQCRSHFSLTMLL